MQILTSALVDGEVWLTVSITRQEYAWIHERCDSEFVVVDFVGTFSLIDIPASIYSFIAVGLSSTVDY